ncbi:MAG: GNAT family N-acetyltransferase [Anaerolineae bacterium]
MTDMLVKLYTLPPVEPALQAPREAGVLVRRALAPEKGVVLEWVSTHFHKPWVSEVDVSFARLPISCFIAVKDGQMLGFAVYDATARGFFGPTGVSEDSRGLGLGKALLLACLHDMLNVGYGYAAIGGVGPAEFYAKAAGATIIEDSTPGIYKGMIR